MLASLFLLIAAQSGSTVTSGATTTPPVPERFSILLPECRADEPATILVCGQREGAARLPLPDDAGPPDRGVPSNRDRTGIGALAASAPPCATLQGGCQVGVNVLGPPVAAIRLLTKLINPRNDCCASGEATSPLALARDGYTGIKGAFARKPDKSGRVAIPLDDPPLRPLEP